MKTYIIPSALFVSNKKMLDGMIFWRYVPEGIAVRMAAPSPGLREWLEKHSIANL